MRKQIWIICIIVLAVCFVLLLKTIQHQKIALPQPSATVTNQASPTEQSKASENPQSTSIPKPPPALVAEAIRRSTPEGSNAFQQRILADWQRPIEFYGKIVDENTNPVAGASITFGWSETPTKEGELTAMTKSDVEGLFSLHGKHGPSLDIWFGKDGYYASHHGQIGVSYMHGDFSPDPRNPVIFVLHKKGEGVELITSENGMRSDVWVRIPKDNTPVRVDLLQKQASTTGQLEISQVKPLPPFQGATNWSFRMSIPDGGLVENYDEFQFAAPEFGYQPTVEYDFTKGETNWTTQVSKQFYIVFGQPRKYGWLRIESNLAQETIFLTYAINPTGSQNLEPQ